jgi:hypothetical protein
MEEIKHRHSTSYAGEAPQRNGAPKLNKVDGRHAGSKPSGAKDS